MPCFCISRCTRSFHPSDKDPSLGTPVCPRECPVRAAAARPGSPASNFACWGGDARPTIRSTILRIDGADVDQQHFITELTAISKMQTPCQVFMVARDAYQQHSALHTDRPDQLVAVNKGVPHRWPFANNAAAFPRPGSPPTGLRRWGGKCRAPSLLALALHGDD